MNHDRFDVKLADFLKEYINSEPHMVAARHAITKHAGRYLAELDAISVPDAEGHFLYLVQRFYKV